MARRADSGYRNLENFETVAHGDSVDDKAACAQDERQGSYLVRGFENGRARSST